MDFLVNDDSNTTNLVDDFTWVLDTPTTYRSSEQQEFKSSCKRKNCKGTLTCIGLNPMCTVDVSSSSSSSSIEAKPLIHGACFNCSECGHKPHRRAAWIRYCCLCRDAFAENGFFQHHGGISSRKGEKNLEKRSAGHKKALYLKLNELSSSKFPYGSKSSNLTLEKLQKEVPLLPTEQKWLFASLHFPSSSESMHVSTMSQGWVESALRFVEDMKQVRLLTVDDMAQIEKENKVIVTKRKKKKSLVETATAVSSKKKRKRNDIEDEDEEDEIELLSSVMTTFENSIDDSDTSDPDEMYRKIPSSKRSKLHHVPSVRRWYYSDGSPRHETYFEDPFLSGDTKRKNSMKGFGDSIADHGDLDTNSREVYKVLCEGIDAYFVFTKNPPPLKHPIENF